MMTEEMTNTVFGEVLGEMLEARNMPPVIACVEALADGANAAGAEIDGEKLIARIQDTSTEHPGDATMAALSERLELSRRERTELAFAFSYERRIPELPGIPELTPGQESTLQSAIRRLDSIGIAIATVEDNPSPSARVQEETLDELRMLSEEAKSRVMALKRQYGFKNY